MAIDDVQDSLAAFGDRYLRKVFTASEINDCQGRNRVHRLAARFAAKEAVIKAFAEPDMPFPLREIEVTRDGPLPLLHMSGAVAERAQHKAGSARLCRFPTPIATQWPSFSWSVVRPSPSRKLHALRVRLWSAGLNGVLDTLRQVLSQKLESDGLQSFGGG